MTKPNQPLAIILEIDINAPPEKIWQIIGSGEGMQAWLGMHGFEPRVGGAYRMHVTTPEGVFDFFGEVTACEPPNKLSFTWTQQEEGKQPWPLSTLVTLTVEAKSENLSRVRLHHTGFEQLPPEMAEEEHAGHILGWERSQALQELKQLAESDLNPAKEKP
jgi:uncharacterized protein YndB with AHSA1/START domain